MERVAGFVLFLLPQNWPTKADDFHTGGGKLSLRASANGVLASLINGMAVGKMRCSRGLEPAAAKPDAAVADAEPEPDAAATSSSGSGGSAEACDAMIAASN